MDRSMPRSRRDHAQALPVEGASDRPERGAEHEHDDADPGNWDAEGAGYQRQVAGCDCLAAQRGAFDQRHDKQR